VRDVVNVESFIVTGDPGDMLMGTLLMGNAFKPYLDTKRTIKNPMFYALDKPWINIIPKCLKLQKLITKK